MDQPVICTLSPSPVRRVTATVTLAGVALLLLWVVLATPPQHPGWLLFLLGTGAGMLWLSVRLWQATDRRIILTRAGLFDSNGTCIAPLEQIVEVDRGVFAFKPSGGFVLRLTHAPGRAWAPGLWWRLGRKLGVGGVTGNAQGRAMAEMIAIVLSDRDGRLHGSDPDA
ncbi:hypothetical protein ACVDG3_00035 [Meridianimarinicoccus sp. RP-17]|uniref:hypothetical protein n=1 Tax=Meridianimarinicoccus zhengii TaxID=2056810 RepID=UPI000DAE9870|nr:hypothetical protein [Phycocomes zhengii]